MCRLITRKATFPEASTLHHSGVEDLKKFKACHMLRQNGILNSFIKRILIIYVGAVLYWLKKRRYLKMAVKIGEVTCEMTADVKKTEDMKVSLKVGYSDKIKETTFKPLEDLKKGDKVKITVEKI
jgi:hypothetical protein